ncbi:MAG: pyridoxal phosphate-dependent aminotransferase [Bacteroidetes bacterium 4572_112]|nr:MAG: pyridoxal phosphate-dependent aminotransferase [Bacteroidetes bacterium 4572_112]
MNRKKIWLASPHMGGNEMKYVQEAYDTNWVAPLGANVNGFEEDLMRCTKSAGAAALTTGTSAIHLALIMLGVKSGDEVLTSSFTFSASANPITYQCATPIFIDSEKASWNMSPELLEEAIQERIAKGKTPKAIVLVHLYGMPAQIDRILEIANKYDIPLIEDAAESLGSRFKGKALGTYGKMGILSFNGNKIITTSGGGAMISNDVKFIEKARFLATQARDNAPHYQHSEIGYNYRMSNIVAGIGRGQMEVLPLRIEKKREIFKFYKELFADIPEVTLLEEPNEDYFSNYWLTSITINSKDKDREGLRLALEADNIEARPLWKPMHLQPVFADCPAYTDGTSEELFNNGLCMPSDSNMNDEDMARITKVVRAYFKG